MTVFTDDKSESTACSDGHTDATDFSAAALSDPGPAWVDEVDPVTGAYWRFYRTEVEGPGQLTNGKAWIKAFEHVLKKLPKPRRVLQVSKSDAGDPAGPQFSMPAYGVKERNEAAKAMREPGMTPGLPEGARHGVGTQLRLPSGDEVLLVSNVGPQAPTELPQSFREMPLEAIALLAVAARCPHQGGCLNEGEIKDVEDIGAFGAPGKRRRAVLRCPWHNMQFDLQTGEGIGNHCHLPRYPVRVMHGAVYVGTHLCSRTAAADGPARAEHAICEELSMDVDMEGEPPSGPAQGGVAADPAGEVPAGAAPVPVGAAPLLSGRAAKILKRRSTAC